MQEVREFLKGLTTAVRIDGLPNRWLPAEISAHCDLPPSAIERLVRCRTGAMIDRLPCRLELSEEDGCTWVDVDLLAPTDFQVRVA
jgi:hypothetical protein